MTDERNTTESGNAEDRLVSETYRETATERAPEHLDAAVLRNAANATRPRYSSLRAWTRPVAWAATVLLSFALVLELTQSPAPESVLSDVAAPADDESAGLAKRERDTQDVPGLKVTDADMLQRAEDMARMQQGPSYEAGPTQAVPAAAEPELAEEVAPAAAFALSEKSSLQSSATLIEAEAACDESARQEPESWLACIAELEQAGLAAAAAAELELLTEAFPDFDPR